MRDDVTKIEGKFFALAEDFLSSPCFSACPSNALKILVAIGNYFVKGGMKDNGNIIISYKMLMKMTGIRSRNAIALGLRQLVALRLLIVNRGKWSLKRDRQPNRYGIPWYSGHNDGPPIKGYLEIRSVEEAEKLLEGLKEKRKDPEARKMRVVIEFEGI